MVSHTISRTIGSAASFGTYLGVYSGTKCSMAVARGGKCRVGFENALVLSDGRIARDNAEKVSDLAARLAESAA